MEVLPQKSSRGGTPAAQRMRAEGTRAKLVETARALFAERGYHATGTSDVVALAAVTRGALYHHFIDKADLFETAFLETLDELNSGAQAAVAGLSGDLWRQVSGAFMTYLRLVGASQEFQRILLIDGPAVLGWNRWRTLHSEHVAADTADALRRLMQQGILAERPVEPLAHLIQAALNDAALSIAHASDPDAARAEASDAFLFLIEGIRIRTTP